MTNPKIKVNIAPVLLTKLNILSSEYTTEVGGYLIGNVKDNEIYLKDLLIPDQLVSSASVHISGQDQLKLRQKYGDKVKDIIGHWHSHHNMGAFWSTTDEANMQNTMQYKKFFVWIVSSLGDHLVRVSQTEPFPYDFNECKLHVTNLTLDLLRKKVEGIMNEPSEEEKKTVEILDEVDETDKKEDVHQSYY